VVIDEFAEGINILPNLVDRLRELGRQGRAFGMYFFLANQEVNSAVESLKANVGWYVLLKVNRQEEMSLIGRNYPVPLGRGHGYVKVKNEVTTIEVPMQACRLMPVIKMKMKLETIRFLFSLRMA